MNNYSDDFEDSKKMLVAQATSTVVLDVSFSQH